jgi:hypothetical protein
VLAALIAAAAARAWSTAIARLSSGTAPLAVSVDGAMTAQ